MDIAHTTRNSLTLSLAQLSKNKMQVTILVLKHIIKGLFQMFANKSRETFSIHNGEWHFVVSEKFETASKRASSSPAAAAVELLAPTNQLLPLLLFQKDKDKTP